MLKEYNFGFVFFNFKCCCYFEVIQPFLIVENISPFCVSLTNMFLNNMSLGNISIVIQIQSALDFKDNRTHTGVFGSWKWINNWIIYNGYQRDQYRRKFLLMLWNKCCILQQVSTRASKSLILHLQPPYSSQF